MASSPGGKASVRDSGGAAVGKPLEIIPYHPSQIKIEKRGSKRTASSMFCATRKASSTSSKSVVEPQETSRPTTLAPNDSSSVSTTEDSGFLEAIAVVSDVSDLNIISLSIPVFRSTFRHEHSTYTFQTKKVPVLPGVHGDRLDSNRASKHMLRKNDFTLHSEKNAVAKQAGVTSSQKAVLAQMKEYNFQLRRENVNLKSQVESLQNQQRLLAPLQSVGIANEVLKQRSNEENTYEFRAQLRSAHDEIFRLQKEDTRCKLELKSVIAELTFCKQKTDRLLKEKEELVIASEDLSRRTAEVEKLSCASKSAESTNQLVLMKTDLESMRISKKWFEEQLQVAQEARKAAEKDLIAGRLEASVKNAEILELQAKLDEADYLLQKEKRNFEREKESFTQKLRGIEVDMAEQESQLDQIQREKDAMILQLSEKLNITTEGDFATVRDLSENIKDLETDMISLSRSLEQKEEEIGMLHAEKNDALERVDLISRELEARNQSFLELQSIVWEMKEESHNLQERLDALQHENQNLIEETKSNTGIINEYNTLQQSMELLLSELNEQKNIIHGLRENGDAFEIKINHLEEDLSLQMNNLDSTKAANVTLEQQVREKESRINGMEAEMNVMKISNADLQAELEASLAHGSKLQQDLNILAMQLNSSPDPDLLALTEEIVELKKIIQNLEQFENEALDLRERNDALSAAKANLNDKLLEAEKFYEEEVENLREMVITRDDIISSMRGELETVEQDLCRTKEILESNLSDRDRVGSEQVRRLEDLEFALEDYDATRRRLSESVAALGAAEEKLGTLQEDNDSLVEQLQKLLARADALEHENQRLTSRLEHDIDAGEEVKELQAQRIARLESFVAEYEMEIEALGSAKSRLEGQIMTLEAANGKLQSESVLNETLREQLQQLQRGLKSDKSLREELVRNIETAKASLREEISSLDSALQSERQQYVRAKDAVLHLESENMELQQEVNGLQLKADDLRQEVARLKCKGGGDIKGEEHARELQHSLEEKNRSISSLEDHISTLKFHLQQKDAELEDARNTARISAEKHEAGLERSRDSEKTLREELSRQARSLDLLTEERNNYRSQVQQMNLALRNSLEHIKQLRSQASASSSSPSMDESSSMVSDLFHRTTSAGPGRNLTNLQNCLASLRAEMALLQVRLAPAERRSLNGSVSSSPEAKDGTN